LQGIDRLLRQIERTTGAARGNHTRV